MTYSPRQADGTTSRRCVGDGICYVNIAAKLFDNNNLELPFLFTRQRDVLINDFFMINNVDITFLWVYHFSSIKVIYRVIFTVCVNDDII